MPKADKQMAGGAAPVQDIRDFTHLPAFAQFLLDNALGDFAASIIRKSRVLNVPLLRYFAAWPEEQLQAAGVEGNRKLLEAFINNTAAAYLQENLRAWKENQLPLIQGDDIVIEDISKVNYVRRQAFREFLPRYSQDPQVYIRVMEEVDFFTLTQEEESYKTLFEMKEQKIREHHHFIDKINNASPGIIYVYDLLEQKQVYANHRQAELLGYAEEEIVAMDVEALSALLHPDDREKLGRHYADFKDIAEGELRTIEYRVRHKNGYYSWKRGYETVFKRAQDGRPSQAIGISIDVSAEKEASMQLEMREAQLREAQELAGMGSFEWDLDAGSTTISPNLLQIFGLDRSAKLLQFLEYVHPSDRGQVKDAFDTAVRGGGVYELEYRYRKDGPEKVIWSRGKVSMGDGKARTMKGTVMDVTQRHDMIKRLERSEQLHKQAQALTHIGNWSWYIADDHVEWSDEMYRIFGLPPQSEPMRLGRILRLLHPDDRAARYEAFHRAVATMQTEDYIMRVLREDGSCRYVEGKTEVLVDEQGKGYKLAGTCQDITRQHQLNEQIRENEEASSQLINNAPEGIIVIDEQSNILLWNPKAEAIFGWSLEETQGKTLMDTIIPSGLKLEHSEGVHRHHTTGISRVLNRTIEVRAMKKSGEEFYISLTVSRSMRAGRQVYIAFIRDISNEKAAELMLAEQRIQLAQKNRELERNNQELMAFNYIASHDLQEPVRKIQVFSNRIISDEAETLSPPVRDAVDRISSAAGHMHRLIEALIAFSRASDVSDQLERTELDHILADVKILLREKMEEQGASIVAGRLPVLQVIPYQIQQLLENIISNALKYSKPDEPPRIRIEASSIPGNELDLSGADPAQRYCRITIRDNGIGFDQQYASKIFELFQRLHNKHAYSGTGIGLAICKKIVENHDGFLTATSEPGAGSSFHIFLPERQA